MAARSVDDIQQDSKQLQEAIRDATQTITDAEKHLKQSSFSEAERVQLLTRLNYLYENRKALREDLQRCLFHLFLLDYACFIAHLCFLPIFRLCVFPGFFFFSFFGFQWSLNRIVLLVSCQCLPHSVLRDQVRWLGYSSVRT